MAKKKTSQPRATSIPKSKSAPAGSAADESSDPHWVEFSIEGTRAIQLHVASADWQDIAQAASTFWKRVFSELGGRRIREINVLAVLGLGFNVHPRTTPQIRQTRLEFRIGRMDADCSRDAPERDQLLEAAWQALERGLHRSKVLSTNEHALEADFVLRGGKFPKGPARDVKPRRR